MELGPRQEVFFFFFLKFEIWFPKACAQSERYRYLLAGIIEIGTTFLQHRVSIVTGLSPLGYDW